MASKNAPKKLESHFVGDFSSEVIKRQKQAEKERVTLKEVGAAFLFGAMIAGATALIKGEPLEYYFPAHDAVKIKHVPLSKQVSPNAYFQNQNQESSGYSKQDKIASIVNTITSEWRVNRDSAFLIAENVVQASEETNLDHNLILGVIAKESSFKTHAKSVMGASGLMQINHRWHKDKIEASELFEPEKNISVGAKILKEYIDKENGDVALGLQRYNGNKKDASMSYALAVLDFQSDFELKERIQLTSATNENSAKYRINV